MPRLVCRMLKLRLPICSLIRMLARYLLALSTSAETAEFEFVSRFKAGGFLSYFLRAGMGGDADDDGDRIVTAGELATYVRRRFRREGDIPATTREDERNFQNLVIERGGVHVDDVVVRLAGPARMSEAVPQSPAPAPVQVSRAAAVAFAKLPARQPKLALGR